MIRWLGVIFIIIAGFSLWIFFSSKPASKTVSTELPDGYMLEAHYIQYDEQGQVHMVMNSPRMVHFSENSVSFFIKPKVLAYSRQRIPWTITAELGMALHESEQIKLSQNVVIHQAPQLHYPETTIKTSAMSIFPHRAYAETDQPIIILRPDTRIDAVGMQADFKSGIFKLLSSVRGSYAPPPPVPPSHP